MSVSREWLDELLENKLPQALRNVREKPASVTEFIRLVQLDWRMNQVQPEPRAVEWADSEDDQDQERRK